MSSSRKDAGDVGRIVVDCSVTMAWCFQDEADDYTASVLRACAGTDLVVPAIWSLEVMNVLLVAERRRRIVPADSDRFLRLLGELPITVETDTPTGIGDAILGLGRRFSLSSYDASYLELAHRLGVPLATGDRSLRTAAKRMRIPAFSSAP